MSKRWAELRAKLEARRRGHAIVVRITAGDHWECTCGRWWYDNPRCLPEVELLDVVHEWWDHVEFEDRFG